MFRSSSGESLVMWCVAVAAGFGDVGQICAESEDLAQYSGVCMWRALLRGYGMF